MKNNYSFYLFCKLIDVYAPSDEAYDLQYEADLSLFKKYQHSVFNIDTKGEYECMVDFLQDLLNKHNNVYNKTNEAEYIYHFDDWVRYMLSNLDYTESELLPFEEHYQNLLDFHTNTDNFLYLNKFKIN